MIKIITCLALLRFSKYKNLDYCVGRTDSIKTGRMDGRPPIIQKIAANNWLRLQFFQWHHLLVNIKKECKYTTVAVF